MEKLLKPKKNASRKSSLQSVQKPSTSLFKMDTCKSAKCSKNIKYDDSYLFFFLLGLIMRRNQVELALNVGQFSFQQNSNGIQKRCTLRLKIEALNILGKHAWTKKKSFVNDDRKSALIASYKICLRIAREVEAQTTALQNEKNSYTIVIRTDQFTQD